MKVPVDIFLQSIRERNAYFFSTTKINTDIPHHFICIKRTDDNILILTCCTSQFETVRKFVENSNLPFETLVFIPPKGEDTPFTKDTYINCNQYFESTIDEFKEMYNSDLVKYSGEISKTYYAQILNGLHASPLIDEDIKEIIPKETDL